MYIGYILYKSYLQNLKYNLYNRNFCFRTSRYLKQLKGMLMSWWGVDANGHKNLLPPSLKITNSFPSYVLFSLFLTTLFTMASARVNYQPFVLVYWLVSSEVFNCQIPFRLLVYIICSFVIYIC